MTVVDTVYLNKIFHLFFRRSQPQGFILEPMKAFNYKVNEGTCYGYCILGIQAFYSNDIATFNNRIATLIYARDEILAFAENSQLGMATSSRLNEAQVNDLKSFFDAVMLAQDPTDYHEFFNSYVSQFNVETTFPLIASKKIEERGGLVLLEKWTGIYTRERLWNLITALDETAGTQHDMSFQLAGHRHSISLVYSAESQDWRIIDANHPHLAFETFSPGMLLDKLFLCFGIIIGPKRHGNDCIAFTTQPISVGDDKEHAQEFLAKLKENKRFRALQEVTPEAAALTSVDGTTWAHVAGLEDEEVYKKLSALGVNLDRPNSRGFTPRLAQEFREYVRSGYQLKLSSEYAEYRELVDLIALNKGLKLDDYSNEYSLRLTTFANAMSEQARQLFTQKLGEGKFAGYVKTAHDLTLLGPVSKRGRAVFLARLTDDKLINMIKNADDLAIILWVIPDQRRTDFLNNLGATKLRGLVTGAQDAIVIMHAMLLDEINTFLDIIADTSALPNLDPARKLMYVGHIRGSESPKDFKQLKEILNNQQNIDLSEVVECQRDDVINHYLLSASELVHYSATLSLMSAKERSDYLGEIDDLEHEEPKDLLLETLYHADINDLCSFLKGLSDAEKNIVFDQLGSEFISERLIGDMGLQLLAVAPNDKITSLIDECNFGDKNKHHFSKPFLYGLLAAFSPDKVQYLIEKLDNATIIANLEDTLILEYTLKYIPENRLSSFLDALHSAIKNGSVIDNANLLPILEDRANEFAAGAEQEIIAQLRRDLHLAENLFSGLPKPTATFFSQAQQYSQQQIIEMTKMMDKIEYINDAIRLITDFLTSELNSDSINPATVSLIKILYGEENKGLLSLGSEELKVFHSGKEATNSQVNKSFNPALDHITKDKIQDTIYDLNRLADTFSAPPSPRVF